MARLQANPNVEANLAFDVIKPGEYLMRVKDVKTTDDNGNDLVSAKGNKYWKVQLEFVETGMLERNDGKGYAKNPGAIFDNSLLVEPSDKQGKLRAFVEACGLTWGDIESDDLRGCEVLARLGTSEYKGEMKNEVKRYIPRS